MRCSVITFGLLCCLLLIESGLGRPQESQLSPEEQEQNDNDEQNEEASSREDGDNEYKDVKSEFISHPQNFTVNVGDSLTLPCLFKGNAPFTWVNRTDATKPRQLFLETIKVDAKNDKIKLSPDYSLQISNIRSFDAGVFRCQILVQSPTPLVLDHHVQVNHPARILSIEPSQKKEVLKGSPLTLLCNATGSPAPSVMWVQRHRNGKEIINSHDGSEITFLQVTPKHSGIHECVAKNSLSGESPATASVEISVLYAPELTVERNLINTAQDVVSELICSVHGNPTPSVHWYLVSSDRQDELIRESAHYRMSNMNRKHTLRIEKTNPSDFGTYFCKANNSLGEVKEKIILSGKPTKPEIQEVKAASDGKSPFLSWLIESVSPITKYELKFRQTMGSEEWKVIHPSVEKAVNDNIYQLEVVIPNLKFPSYEAILRAENKYGWSEESNSQIFSSDYRVPDVNPVIPEVVENIKSKGSENAGVQLRIPLMLLFASVVFHYHC